MRYQQVENGAIVPALPLRAEFARDLWETIRNQILGHRTQLTQLVDGQRMTFSLPMPVHLLDFVTITEGDVTDSVIVDLQLPGKELTRDSIYAISFVYTPPANV